MAMKYQLPNGKTIFIEFEDWLNLTDEKIQEYMAENKGFIIDDPFKEPNYKEFESEEYKLPNIDDYVEPLDDDSLNEIKKQIDESD